MKCVVIIYTCFTHMFRVSYHDSVEKKKDVTALADAEAKRIYQKC